MRVAWGPTLERAAAIVGGSATAMTLRQLFYVLVTEQLLPNNKSAYTTLSARSAEARRAGWFPALIDQTRSVHQANFYDDAEDARQVLHDEFRLDRTIGQEWQIWVGTEKRGQLTQLRAWFDHLGVPILPFGGWTSQTLKDDVSNMVRYDGRPAVLIYAGDFDPSGVYMLEDFQYGTDCWEEVQRIAVNPEQIDELGLVESIEPSSYRDKRYGRFVSEYGAIRQVEIEAIPVATLRDIYQTAIDDYWDGDAFQETMQREADELERLRELI